MPDSAAAIVIREIRALKSGTQSLPISVLGSAGINDFLRRPESWHSRARICCSTRLPLGRNLWIKATIQKTTGRPACRATLPAICFRLSLRTGLEPNLLTSQELLFTVPRLSRITKGKSFPKPQDRMNLSLQQHLTLNNIGLKGRHGVFSGTEDPPSAAPFSQAMADINKRIRKIG